MEHMDSGSLTSLITKFQIPEPLIAYVCKEVCQGLQYTPPPQTSRSSFRLLFWL
jgi:serine/threonine protein kinase